MATWTTPKTNWVSTDYFNVADYTRITNNHVYLKEMIAKLFRTLSLANMEEKDYTSLIYADEFNAIEDNLTILNKASYNFDIGTGTTYIANGATPTYEEYNRIEQAQLRLYEQLIVDINQLPHISFTLGLYGDLQI